MTKEEVTIEEVEKSWLGLIRSYRYDVASVEYQGQCLFNRHCGERRYRFSVYVNESCGKHTYRDYDLFICPCCYNIKTNSD